MNEGVERSWIQVTSQINTEAAALLLLCSWDTRKAACGPQLV